MTTASLHALADERTAARYPTHSVAALPDAGPRRHDRLAGPRRRLGSLLVAFGLHLMTVDTRGSALAR